jgi:hypothetical protein
MTDQMKDRIRVMLRKAFECGTRDPAVERDPRGRASWSSVREAVVRCLHTAGQDPMAAEHFLDLSRDEQDQLLESYAMEFRDEGA